MREILFRGKRVENGEWVEGNYGERFDGEGIVSCISKPTKETISGTLCYDVDPSTVGQYTGLTDRNGDRIWKGDIVEFEDGATYSKIGNVIFYEGAFCIEYLFYGYKRYHRIGQVDEEHDMGATFTISYKYKVIGNIHDNPELIGGEKQ